MLAKAHKSLIKVSCRAEILKHSQTNSSKEVSQRRFGSEPKCGCCLIPLAGGASTHVTLA
jgi:hypothetical protein